VVLGCTHQPESSFAACPLCVHETVLIVDIGSIGCYGQFKYFSFYLVVLCRVVCLFSCTGSRNNEGFLLVLKFGARLK